MIKRTNKKRKEISKTRKVLKIIMWSSGILTLVPYIVFTFSYPFTKLVCSYLYGYCYLKPSVAVTLTKIAFNASYYAWWIIAPIGLLSGLIYAAILVVQQAKDS